MFLWTKGIVKPTNVWNLDELDEFELLQLFSKLFRPSELRGSDHSKVLNLAASRVDFDDAWESQLTRRFQGASISNIKHVVCFDFNRKHVKHMAMTNVLYV